MANSHGQQGVKVLIVVNCFQISNLSYDKQLTLRNLNVAMICELISN